MARHFTPDDRHGITDPYTDAGRWAQSVIKGRVAELFLTSAGLPGHVTQIQQEISRLVSSKHVATKMEGRMGDEVMEYIMAVESVKSAIVSAAKAATFDFNKFKLDFGSLTPEMYLERSNGKFKRDGKPG
jgi:hypothetical protein